MLVTEGDALLGLSVCMDPLVRDESVVNSVLLKPLALNVSFSIQLHTNCK